jgi:hypothetical protein
VQDWVSSHVIAQRALRRLILTPSVVDGECWLCSILGVTSGCE